MAEPAPGAVDEQGRYPGAGRQPGQGSGFACLDDCPAVSRSRQRASYPLPGSGTLASCLAAVVGCSAARPAGQPARLGTVMTEGNVHAPSRGRE